MRLKNLRLTGFKSFVDPTNVTFPSNLTAIVGPNGCGKSNTIDAVRWVMGESSAKHLRGESMADVIFSGSANRAPVGQASVELVFDNAQGKLGGEYAQYNEIAIKRQVNRDGQSHYFLNNTECRRKDIREIFLGTGLGSRSYSIIEQGMISRFIEARPEDLRLFIEEAAGISKYKERRRETENRIKHTRENLERLSDIRLELEKQLERLQRQAKAAEKYTDLKAQAREKRAQLQALKYINIQEKLDTLSSTQTEQELLLEARRADQQKLDSDLESYKQQRHDADEVYQDKQQAYYQIGADIARLEQAIASGQERRASLVEDLQQTEAEFNNLNQHQAQDRDNLAKYTKELDSLNPQVEQTSAQYETSKDQLHMAEEARADWQNTWDEFNTTAQEATKSAHVEQTKIQHLETQLRQSQARLEGLSTEQTRLSTQNSAEQLHGFEAKVSDYKTQQTDLQTQLADNQQRLSIVKATLREAFAKLDEQKSQNQTLIGREASLHALQQAALGKDAGGAQAWLSEQQLTDAPRLAEGLDISPGWERAVETVLGQYLQAVWVEDFSEVSNALADLAQGCVTLIQRTASTVWANHALANPLLSKITQPSAVLTELLTGVYIAKDLNSALNLQPKLTAQESVITPEGIWLGHNWLRVTRDEDVHHGVLARAAELKQLSQDLEANKQAIEQQQGVITQHQENIIQLESARESLQQNLSELAKQITQVEAEAKIIQNKQTANTQRLDQITAECVDLKEKFSQDQSQLNQARETWQAAMASMETDAQTRDKLTQEREQINQRLDQAREQTNQYRDQAHELLLLQQNAQTQLYTLQQNLDRMQSRSQDLNTRVEGLKLAIQQADAPDNDLSTALAEKLERHSQAEQAMQQARECLDHIDEQITALEQQRHHIEEQAREVQVLLDQTRLDAQTFKVRLTTIQEALEEMEASLDQVKSNLPPEATETTWEEALTQLDRQIQRLGAINLAAIDEYQTESERKSYLDSQHEDLEEALTTLESAIAKIDKETKQKFRETYDIVNNSFKELFPKLFGGGRAYLELTDDDLLTTGITVMAQPPGKRNSTIHLLSGGEKAMTAVALVFSIFKLNPSPFCMLDEVDAPLDDANVSRFCRLVEEMSKNIQFIIITHNKVTMELAQHLAGVTMHEPGVSRLVSVDVDEAVSLVQEEQVA